MNLPEREYIGLCKRLIEEKLQLESSEAGMRTRDLEYLADAIEESSGMKLSLSTLKRLWKKDYDQTPHPSTLQAMVSLLGYKDWQEFKLKAKKIATPTKSAPKSRKLSFKIWMSALGFALLLLVFWLIGFRTAKDQTAKPFINGPVIFTGNKTVSQGVPNTVIFKYDVSNVRSDSFFFQQSWNTLSKVRIDSKGHYYNTIYYYPGFHKAKLIANDSVIKRFRVHITTDGWLPIIRTSFIDSLPVYVKNYTRNGGALEIGPKDIQNAGGDPAKDFILSYFNVRDFDNTNSDNFLLDTKIKCDSTSNLICTSFLLRIICEEDVFDVLLMGKGCEQNAYYRIGEVYKNGASSDLSSFGRNLYSWQHLQVRVQNKFTTISIDDKIVDTFTFKKDFGKIVGLVYNFSKLGAVEFVRLTNGENKIVYNDEFNK